MKTTSSEVVHLAIRNGDKVETRIALVLAAHELEDGTSRLEVVSVNPAALRHFGTSDYQLGLLHQVDVPHVSHDDFLAGKISTAYGNLFVTDQDDDNANEAQLPAGYTVEPGQMLDLAAAVGALDPAFPQNADQDVIASAIALLHHLHEQQIAATSEPFGEAPTPKPKEVLI